MNTVDRGMIREAGRLLNEASRIMQIGAPDATLSLRQEWERQTAEWFVKAVSIRALTAEEASRPDAAPAPKKERQVSHWRAVDQDGGVGLISTDPPDDEPDEGETGPEEVTG